jgi:hypothetical protein
LGCFVLVLIPVVSWLRVEGATNVRRFQSYYGSSNLVCSVMWEDLVSSQDIKHPRNATFDKFLLAFYFLKEYPTEEKLAGMWHTCERGALKWVRGKGPSIESKKDDKMSVLALGIIMLVNSLASLS